MSYLKKLGLYGIRSYGDINTEKYEEIYFFKPLTLILGNNGAGKSTIIEALKVITTGSFPPNSQNGKTFIKDPRLMGPHTQESQGTISLIFKAINQKQILVRRLFSVHRDKNDKLSFDSKDATIKVKDKNSDKEISVNHKCIEITKQVPQLLGVSKAVFDNVIFCHQDESLWPFGDNTTLKNIFDELFDTKQFTKLQESLQKQQKEIKKEQLKLHLEIKHYKLRYEEAVQEKQKIAKDAEDLLEETSKLEALREQYASSEEKGEKEEEVLQQLQEARSHIQICEYKLNQIRQTQSKILSECFNHYFMDQNLSSLKDLVEQLKMEKQNSSIKKQQCEETIEIQRKAIDKLRNELDQLRYADKNLKQLYLDLKILKEKLQGIINCVVESEENLVQEAQKFKRQLESKYIKESNVLKEQEAAVSMEFQVSNQKVQANLEELVVLKERKEQMKETMDQQNKELNALQAQQSTTNGQLAEAADNLDSAKLNCQEFEEQIDQLNGQINDVKKENEVINRQIQILNQQTAIRSKQLEYLQMTKQVTQLQEQHEAQEKEFNALGVNTDLAIQFQIAPQKEKVKEAKLSKARIESEVSKMTGKIEHLEAIQRGYEDTISDIAKIFKENNLLYFMTSSENNADFTSKYQSVKEEIEGIRRDIIEKETFLMLDKQILQYASDKGKCKFCKQEVTNETLGVLSKSQNERVKRAENDLKNVQEEFQKRMEEKKAIKQLKDKYEECQETKLKSAQNCLDIKAVKVSLKELQDKVAEEELLIQQEIQILGNLEAAQNLQSQLLKAQRQIFEQQRSNQQFLMDNPFLQDVDNIKIISAEEAEQMHQAQKDNLLKLEALQNQLIKENQKHNQYLISVKSFEMQKQMIQKTLDQLRDQQSILERENQNLKEKSISFDFTAKELEKSVSVNKEKAEKVKASLNAITEQSQNLLQQFNASQILVDDYLPQFEKILAQYTELKNVKGKARGKLQENQLQLLEGQLLETEKSKQNNERLLVGLIETLDEQNKEYVNLSKGINYVELILEYEQIEKDIEAKNKYAQEKMNLLSSIQAAINQRREQFMQLRTFESQCKLKKQTIEIDYATAVEKYDQAEEIYCREQVNLEIKNGIHQDISVYLEELERTLITFHKEKMQQINKCIADTWRKIYQGKDIKKLEIKAEEMEGKGKKAYNYRIIMHVQSEEGQQVKEIDMKGRCSAGQKVLASIIIRLALAEAFTINCGILALDEPTTNLDKQHAIKLGEQLCDLIEARKGQDSFQLIIISHDKDFISLMQQKTHCNDFYQIYKENGCSKIMRRTYKNALMNKTSD